MDFLSMHLFICEFLIYHFISELYIDIYHSNLLCLLVYHSIGGFSTSISLHLWILYWYITPSVNSLLVYHSICEFSTDISLHRCILYWYITPSVNSLLVYHVICEFSTGISVYLCIINWYITPHVNYLLQHHSLRAFTINTSLTNITAYSQSVSPNYTHTVPVIDIPTTRILINILGRVITWDCWSNSFWLWTLGPV